MNLIDLEWRERKALERLSKHTSDATTLRRAQALLWLDRGESVADVAGHLGVSRQVIYQWIEIFRARDADDKLRAKITALACSEAPEGHARWRLRLLAEKVVELDYCDSISYSQVRKILKKRTEATSQQDLVYWKDRCSVHRPNGAPIRALRPAI